MYIEEDVWFDNGTKVDLVCSVSVSLSVARHATRGNTVTSHFSQLESIDISIVFIL